MPPTKEPQIQGLSASKPSGWSILSIYATANKSWRAAVTVWRRTAKQRLNPKLIAFQSAMLSANVKLGFPFEGNHWAIAWHFPHEQLLPTNLIILNIKVPGRLARSKSPPLSRFQDVRLTNQVTLQRSYAEEGSPTRGPRAPGRRQGPRRSPAGLF